MRTQSFRFRGGVARVARWHGHDDVAQVALRCSGAPAPAAIERLVARLRDAGFREVVTNALGPAASVPLVDSGFAVRGRLRLLAHELSELPPETARTRRARRADHDAILGVDAAAFDEFWRMDDVGLREAARSTPSAHTRVAIGAGAPIGGYALFGRAERDGYVQRLAVHPREQGAGLGRALLVDGLHWLRRHGVRRVLVNTQDDNERAFALYVRAGFEPLPVGLCVLGRSL